MSRNNIEIICLSSDEDEATFYKIYQSPKKPKFQPKIEPSLPKIVSAGTATDPDCGFSEHFREEVEFLSFSCADKPDKINQEIRQNKCVNSNRLFYESKLVSLIINTKTTTTDNYLNETSTGGAQSPVSLKSEHSPSGSENTENIIGIEDDGQLSNNIILDKTIDNTTKSPEDLLIDSEVEQTLEHLLEVTSSKEDGECSISLDKTESCSSQVIQVIEEECAIQELCVIQGNVKQSKKRETWYDNDTVIDTQAIFKRWNIKKIADQNVNNSRANYRNRVYKETKKPGEARRFRPGIFVGEHEDDWKDVCINDLFENGEGTGSGNLLSRKISTKARFMDQPEVRKTVLSSEDLIKKDETGYQERIKCIDTTTTQAVKDVLKQQIKQFTELKRANTLVVNNIKNNWDLNPGQKTYQINNTFSNHNQMKQQVKHQSKAEIFGIEEEAKQEREALGALYKSGNYKRGKLEEYVPFELLQPKSKRLKYDDDGKRHLLMMEKDALNVMMEDRIYTHYYGECR